jgi:Na+-driven multidrug efflux pump
VGQQGLWLAVLLAIPLTLLIWNAGVLLGHLEQAPDTVALAEPYLRAIAWGYFPGLGFAVLRSFMGMMTLLFWAFPERIISLYLDIHNPENAAVVALGKRLLGIAAVFQIMDGVQAVSAGALRGLKDTRIPMLIAILAYWCVGLTSGCLLGFKLDLGGVGLWWGLALGLMVAAIVLPWRFFHNTCDYPISKSL